MIRFWWEITTKILIFLWLFRERSTELVCWAERWHGQDPGDHQVRSLLPGFTLYILQDLLPVYISQYFCPRWFNGVRTGLQTVISPHILGAFFGSSGSVSALKVRNRSRIHLTQLIMILLILVRKPYGTVLILSTVGAIFNSVVLLKFYLLSDLLLFYFQIHRQPIWSVEGRSSAFFLLVQWFMRFFVKFLFFFFFLLVFLPRHCREFILCYQVDKSKFLSSFRPF
jgi:hypothetical protein